VFIGIFILGFWFIGSVVFSIKNRKINPNLFIGFFLLCIGYIMVDLKLFYVMFILKTPLNRNDFSISRLTGIALLKLFLHSLKEYFLHGYYHASSFQRKIIVLFAFIMSVFCLFKLVRAIKNKKETIFVRIKMAIKESNIHVKWLFILEFIAFVFSIITALYDSHLLHGFIKRYINSLSGFNWGRVWIFNRVLWYLIFALCLQIVLGINWKLKSRLSISKLCAGVLIGCQLLIISLNKSSRWQPYDDQFKTWYNETVIKTSRKNTELYISYKEYLNSGVLAISTYHLILS